MKTLSVTLMMFVMCFALITQAKAQTPDNFHLVEQNPATGFALFRSGRPNKEMIKSYCDAGITEVMVLSGDAKSHEQKWQSECPQLKVIYDVNQNGRKPLDKIFLQFFDQWIESAQAEGKKVLIRCQCGCHRTGRLAAYYRMKYDDYSREQAYTELTSLANWMWFNKDLKAQVDSLEDYIEGKDCDSLDANPEYCIK